MTDEFTKEQAIDWLNEASYEVLQAEFTIRDRTDDLRAAIERLAEVHSTWHTEAPDIAELLSLKEQWHCIVHACDRLGVDQDTDPRLAEKREVFGNAVAEYTEAVARASALTN